MKGIVTNRVAVVVAAAAVFVIGACSDSGSTQPNLSGPNPSSAAGARGDTSKTGGTHDSSGSHTPTTPPVAKFTLIMHVRTPRPGVTDTVATDPVQGATVSVIRETYTFTSSGNGSDTLHITNTVVATGSSDANGDVSFPGLDGTGVYLIKAVPPPGSALGPATTDLVNAYLSTVNLQITLHGR